MRSNFLYILLILICTFNLPPKVFAQKKNAIISGKVFNASSSSNEEVIGATIQIEGTSLGTSTDIEGKFTLTVQPGTYNLTCRYIGFKTESRPITLSEGELINQVIALEEENTTLTEVIITQKVARSSNVAMLLEKKNSALIQDVISADFIQKTPDRSASDVLRRVTGSSTQEGKFSIVRGMNDRYNMAYLDNAILPSTEADRKAFSFDVIPANLIDNIQIIKVGSADLSGDFGGGVIKVNTKSIPETFNQSISVGQQFVSNTGFDNFKSFTNYKNEEWNIVSPKRKVPIIPEGTLKLSSSFPGITERQRLAESSALFSHDWQINENKSPLNTRISYGIGFPIQLSASKKLGFLLGLNYANTRKNQQGQVETYDGSGKVSDFTDHSYLHNVSEGAICNLNYNAEKIQINMRNLYNSTFDRNLVERSGMANYSDGLRIYNIASVNNYNRLTNSVFSIKHILGEQFLVTNLSISYGDVSRMIPDYKIASFAKTDEDDMYRLNLGDFFNTSTGRFYSNMHEKNLGINLDTKHTFNDKLSSTLRIGGFAISRQRNYSSRTFVYGGQASVSEKLNVSEVINTNSIGADKLYLVEKTSEDLAYYTGNTKTIGGFIMIDQKWTKNLKANYGVRFENYSLDLENKRVNMDIASKKQLDILPSLNLCYNLGEKTNIRASYFKSVNRPEFRELAPFAFYVFDKNAEIKGNSNLAIAKIDNLDLRIEKYPNAVQLLSAGIFYKHVNNPIEFAIDITQPFTTFTYVNAKSSNLFGAELEVRKDLQFIYPSKILSRFNFFANVSLTLSSLAFIEGSQAKQGRSLQGQSPYMYNAGLAYEYKGWSASLAINEVGPRISYVGVDPKYGQTRQDIYEKSRLLFDAQISKRLHHFLFKLNVADLFHQDQIFYQDADQNKKFNEDVDRILFRYKQNYGSTISISYQF